MSSPLCRATSEMRHVALLPFPQGVAHRFADQPGRHRPVHVIGPGAALGQVGRVALGADLVAVREQAAGSQRLVGLPIQGSFLHGIEMMDGRHAQDRQRRGGQLACANRPGAGRPRSSLARQSGPSAARPTPGMRPTGRSPRRWLAGTARAAARPGARNRRPGRPPKTARPRPPESSPAARSAARGNADGCALPRRRIRQPARPNSSDIQP